jgi:hypothetical protein
MSIPYLIILPVGCVIYLIYFVSRLQSAASSIKSRLKSGFTSSVRDGEIDVLVDLKGPTLDGSTHDSEWTDLLQHNEDPHDTDSTDRTRNNNNTRDQTRIFEEV